MKKDLNEMNAYELKNMGFEIIEHSKVTAAIDTDSDSENEDDKNKK